MSHRAADSKWPQHAAMARTPGERERTAFGNRMRTARTRAGLTQMQVCKEIKCSQSTLAELEATANSSGLVAKFAALYKVPALWLAEGPDEAPPSDNGPPARPPRDFAEPRQITEEEFELVRDFRDLADGDKEKVKAMLLDLATSYRKLRKQWLDDLKTKGLLREGLK